MSTAFHNFLPPIGSAWVDTSSPTHTKIGLFDNAPTPALVGILTFQGKTDHKEFLRTLVDPDPAVTRIGVAPGKVYYKEEKGIQSKTLLSEYGHIIQANRLRPILGLTVENVGIGENWC